mgnify:CR=1 FL=1
MSGTLSNIYSNVNFALHLNSEAMTRLQEQASTGSQVNRTSDDPATAYRVIGLNSQVKSLENYGNHISDSIAVLELSSTVIEDMVSGIRETKGSLTQITNGIYDEDARNRSAEEVRHTLEQMILLANSEHMDQYLFGGTGTVSYTHLTLPTN